MAVRQKARDHIRGWTSRRREAALRANERRRFPRFECSLPVTLHIDTPGHLEIIEAMAMNLSTGGMLLKAATVPERAASCHVEFSVPGWFPRLLHGGHTVMSEACVRYNDKTRGIFGLAFARPLQCARQV